MKRSDFWTKIKAFLSRSIPEFAIIIGGLILDLVSKSIIAATMNRGDTIVIIPKFLNFSYTINTRAAFGSTFGLDKVFGEQGALIFFIVLTIIAVGFFGFLLFRNHNKGILYRIAFSLIIGGALGNLYDRIFLSGVRDFIQIEYFGLELFGQTTFAIFNIADSCVVVGTILLLIYLIFFDKTFKEPAKVSETDIKSQSEADDLQGPSKENTIDNADNNSDENVIDDNKD